MNSTIIIASLIAGISTGCGALPVYFKKEFSKQFLDASLGFSAGIMIVATFSALLFPSLDSAKAIYPSAINIMPVIFGLIIGYKSIIYLHCILPHEHFIKHEEQLKSAHYISRVYLIVLAICLHNIPEGLSVGVGFAGPDLAAGMTLAIAISIQNMPEGLVVALGLISIGVNKHRAVGLSFISGMIEPVAALIGYFTTKVSIYLLPFALAFAGGAMLFVVCQEMFPEIFKEGHEKSATNGLITGVGLMLIINHFLA